MRNVGRVCVLMITGSGLFDWNNFGRNANAAETATWSGKGAVIHEAFQRLETLGFAGVVLASLDGEIVMAQGYGWANRSAKTPWTPATVSCIGSITKQFTAAAIMKLEAMGKLSTSDSITKFFPDIPSDKAGITIHHLLTHTAGLPSDLGDDYDPISRDEIVRRALATELNSAPGAEYRYSNTGYSLLGAIIEVVSGGPYEQFVRHELLIPAGSFETGYRLPHFPLSRVARGYEGGVESPPVIEHPWAEDGPYWNLRANGGIHSTVFDMYRWTQALFGGRVLPQEQWKELVTPTPLPDGREMTYAYGWSSGRTSRGTTVVGHTGGNGIFFSSLQVYPDEKAVIFLMTNQAEFPAEQYASVVSRLLFGEPYEMPPRLRSAELTAEQLRTLTGSFSLPDGGRLQIAALGDRLRVSADGQQAVDLLIEPATEDRAALKKLTERSHALLERLSREATNESAVLSDSESDAAFKRLHRHWLAAIKERGACRGFSVLGTAPWRRERGGWAATWIRVDFVKEPMICRFHWTRDGEYVGLGGSVYPWPVTLIGVPTSNREFTAVDDQGGVPPVQFVLQDESADTPATLRITTQTTKVVAKASAPAP